MVDEAKLAETIRLGNLAKDVLENDAFNTVFEMAMQDIFVQFLGTTAEDEKQREKLWAIGQALDVVRERLHGLIAGAKVEKANQEHDNN